MTPEVRSRVMRAITKKNTKPELIVRQALHRMGLRFRLHDKQLPGTPDIVLRKHNLAILVHGCFWHQHPGCRYAKLPHSRPNYWLPKLARNVERDRHAQKALRTAGWRSGIIWECDARDPARLKRRLQHLFRRSPRLEPKSPHCGP